VRVYRVRLYSHAEGSQGYEWFASKEAATKAAGAFRRTWKEHDPETEVEPVEIQPTKAGILDALNRYASHNDNG
jgi:hypothetical protein